MKGGVLENRSRELVTYLQLFFGERILVDVPSICMRTPKLSNGFGDSGFNGWRFTDELSEQRYMIR